MMVPRMHLPTCQSRLIWKLHWRGSWVSTRYTSQEGCLHRASTVNNADLVDENFHRAVYIGVVKPLIGMLETWCIAGTDCWWPRSFSQGDTDMLHRKGNHPRNPGRSQIA